MYVLAVLNIASTVSAPGRCYLQRRGQLQVAQSLVRRFQLRPFRRCAAPLGTV